MNKLNPLVAWAFAMTRILNPNHYNSLLGERPSGSQWGFDIKLEDYLSLAWHEVSYLHQDVLVPGCIYLKASARPFLDDLNKELPTQRIELLSDLSLKFIAASVKVQEGAHGLELVSDQIEEQEVEEVSMILGKAEVQEGSPASMQPIDETLMVWTAYPGRITCPLPQDWDGKLESLDTTKPYAIKGI
jgi:hypothetical protein